MNLNIGTITKICNGVYNGKNQNQEIDGIEINSKLIKNNYIFIAIKGEKFDGNDFIKEALNNGALCVITEKDIEDFSEYIKVESVYDALKKIATYYREKINTKIIGITGSVGKTSTKEMLASVISQKYNTYKTKGNLNGQIGLPLSILDIKNNEDVAILEMGISDFNEMDCLSKIAKPDMCLITNIGICHLENFKTRDGIFKSKTEIFNHMKQDGKIFLNGDDDKLKTLQKENIIIYGINNKKNIYVTDIKDLGLNGISVKINTQLGSFNVKINIPGKHNIYNALASTAIGIELGLTLKEIKNGIELTKPHSGRNNIVTINKINIIDDCYNANPISMKAAIDILSTSKDRTIAVLGDMGELGENEKKYHYELGKYLTEKNINTLFCIGKLAEEYKKGALSTNKNIDIFYFNDKNELLNELLKHIKENDTILFKASHFMNFSDLLFNVINNLTK